MAAARTWTLILLALALLYVGTEPPAHRWLMDREMTRSILSVGGGSRSWTAATWRVPNWLVAYDKPYKCLESQPVTGPPLAHYRQWWARHYLDFFPK